MKIAVSGTHRTGKTTLIDELIGPLPTFTAVEEPYRQLEEEGYIFAAMPSLEDFELQLERSIESILGADGDTLFDRAPVDLLAYLTTHTEAGWFDIDRWSPQVRESMRQLDLIVFVPIEEPDRVTLAESDSDESRFHVHEELAEIVLDDRWDFGVPAIEVVGTPDERARRVLTHLDTL